MAGMAPTPQRSSRSSLGGRSSFPILHQSEIIQALAGLKIDISKNELNEPHRNREKLRNVFLQLVSYYRRLCHRMTLITVLGQRTIVSSIPFSSLS
jgi:hypothetical protein